MKSLLLILPVLMLCLPAQDRPATSPAALPTAAPARGVQDLAFLEGAWRGSDGQSQWESWYSSPEGGQVVGASKELSEGRAVMIDFEHFYEREGVLRMTPFPFGKRSVEFTLTSLSAESRRAVFENPEHDFPSRFTYQRADDERLRITLEGEPGGKPMQVTLELQLRKG